jgi:hypothetical protein
MLGSTKWHDFLHFSKKGLKQDQAQIREIVTDPDNDRDRCAMFAGNKLMARRCNIPISCGICQLPPGTKVMMKGLCENDVTTNKNFDMYYYPYGHRNGQ